MERVNLPLHGKMRIRLSQAWWLLSRSQLMGSMCGLTYSIDSQYLRVCEWMWMCVCVCVCVSLREREREREKRLKARRRWRTLQAVLSSGERAKTWPETRGFSFKNKSMETTKTWKATWNSSVMKLHSPDWNFKTIQAEQRLISSESEFAQSQSSSMYWSQR